MNFDFAFVLLVLVAVTGATWLIDTVVLAAIRRRRASALETLATIPPAERSVRARDASQRSVAVEYARSFFPVLALILGVRTCLAEPFKIPSGSMMPTLLVGDYILVNKFAYGVRLPVVNTKILDVGAPKRGDVVVFRPPWAPGEHWIKRVVGLPGDEVTYRDKRLTVNGKTIDEVDVGAYDGPPDLERSMTGAEVGREQLGDALHAVMKLPYRRDGREGTWRVPADHYFVMGDSRDNSIDSRYQGFVPEDALDGRAFMIWMNYDRGIDLSRIGTLLR